MLDVPGCGLLLSWSYMLDVPGCGLWRGISVSINFLSGTIGGTFVAATAAAREAAQL